MALPLEEVISLTDPVFAQIDGYRLSHGARRRTGRSGRSLVYGETLPAPFFQLIHPLALPAGACLMDLGSGAGRAVLYAALLLDLDRVVGVELFPELVDGARSAAGLLTHALGRRGAATSLGRVEWVNADFLDVELTCANLVYVVTAVFEPELLSALSSKLGLQSEGSWVAAVGEPLRSPRLHLHTEVAGYETGWGPSRAFVYRVGP